MEGSQRSRRNWDRNRRLAGPPLIDGNSIKEDLVAERYATDSYREMIAYFSTDDPTSRGLMQKVLAKEEEHADDLVTLAEAWRNDQHVLSGCRP